MPLNSHLRGLLITTSAVLILSPDALLVKLMHCDPWTMLFWRSLISGTAILGALLLCYRSNFLKVIHQTGRYGFLSSLVTSIGSLLFVCALYRTTAANTLVILAATPLFAALSGRIFIGERIARHTKIAIATALGGIVIIFAGSLSLDDLSGSLMALSASALWGTNLVVLRQARQRNMIPAVGTGALLVIPLTLLLGAAPASVSSHDLQLLLVQGTLVLPLSFALITRGARKLPAAEISLVLLLETLLGPLWVWLLVGEVPATATLTAGTLVLATLILHSLISLRRRVPPLPSTPLQFDEATPIDRR